MNASNFNTQELSYAQLQQIECGTAKAVIVPVTALPPIVTRPFTLAEEMVKAIV
jgi:hypothetical protein